MAEIYDVPVLNLDLSETQAEVEETSKTIKSLKDDIKKFRETLEGATIGSDKFNSALEQLTNAQNELKQATKSSIDVVEGSYNALTRQMAEMKAEWKNLNPATEEGKARMAELGKAINDTNNKLKEMDASLGNYQRNVGNYGSAFEGVTMKIEGNTASFERQISTTQAALDSFQLIEGAMQTMGIESEKTEKMLRSVEGAMRMTQGLKSIKEAAGGFKELGIATKAAELQQKLFGASVKSTTVATNTATKATNTFKKALVATGIGALIVGLGLLIANFDKVMKLFQSNSEAADRANESYRRLTNTISELSRNMDKELSIMAIKGASELDILAREAERTKENLSTLKDSLILLKLQYETLKWWQKDAKETTQKTIDETEKYIEELQKRLNEIPDDVEEAQARAQEELRKSIQANFKQSSDAMDKLSEKLEQWGLSKPALDLVKLSDQVNKDRKDLELALERNVITYDEYTKRLKKIDENYKSDREAILQNLYDKTMQFTLSEEDKQLNTLKDQKNNLEKEWEDAYKLMASKEDVTVEQLEEFKKQMEQALSAYNKVYEKNVADVKKMAKDNGWKEVLEEAQKDLENLDFLRERAIEKLATTEISIKKEFENKKDNAITIDFKLDVQKEEMEKLLEVYKKQLGAVKEIDDQERERLQTLIKQAEEQGASNEIIEQYKLQLEQIGGEWEAINEKVKECQENIENIELEGLRSTLESIGTSFNQLGDAISKIAELGPGLGESFGPALAESMQAVGSTITQAGNDFARLKELQKESADETQVSAQKWKTYGNMAATGLGVATNLLSSLAEQQDETSKEGFETQKKLQIASATMAMLQGMVSAFASAMQLGPIAGPIAGAALSAAVATMGAIQIAEIKKQQWGGSADPNTTAAQVSAPAVNAINTIMPAVQTVNAVEGASTESDVKDTRVYVVETDIANTMNKVNVMESEAVY